MRRVLIVDDKPDNLFLLRALLRGRGWEVTEARHGAEALALARERLPDLAVTDLLMPVMDGYTLLRSWKSDPALKEIPLVVYTATYTDPEDEKLALDLGADAFVLKPAEPGVFLDQLDRLLSRAVRGQLPVSAPIVTEEPVVLRQYSEALVRRLEEKSRLLELANRELRAILDAEPACIKQLDSEGRFLDVNAAGLRMLGAAQCDEVAGASFLDLVGEPDRAAFRELIARVFRGESGSIEYRCTPPGGPCLWVATEAVPLREPAGEVIALLGHTRDVTARKDAEARIEQLSRLYAMLSEVNQAIVHARSREELFPAICRAATTTGRLLRTWIGLWDRGAATLTVAAASGRGEEQLVGLAMDATEPGFESGELGQALSTGRLAIARDLQAGLSPTEREMAERAGVRGAAAVPIRQAGEIVGLLALGAGEAEFFGSTDLQGLLVKLATDVSFALDALEAEAARRHAAEALRESEARFRALFENNMDGLLLSDPNGTIRAANPAACHLLGRSESEICRVGRRGIVDESDPRSAAFFDGQAGTGSVRGELSMIRGDGSRLEVEVSSSVYSTPNGVHAYSIIHDISERRRLEAQLVTSERMASMGLLAAGVAHEINNPLAAVIANVDFAIREVEGGTGTAHVSPDLHEVLLDAREAAERLRTVSGDLRLFSRAEDETAGPVDVRKTLESSVRVAWNEIRHRARLERAYDDVPTVGASEFRLGQVFLNLLVNAAHAIPEGRAQANVIRVATRSGPGGKVLVEISDTGSGMSPEVRARLFEPFFTTKPPGLGTGLGLAICHRIVTAVGGTIEVDSEVGKGSTFRVVLPAVEASATDTARAPAAPATERRGRVLVIDDEPAIGKAIVRLLGRDQDVVATTGAREALDRLASGDRFDVILCDLMMPVMTGLDFLAELERLFPGEGARVVFLTGGAFTPAARAFLDRSPNLQVSKPFDSNALRALVSERMTSYAGSRQPVPPK